MLPFVIAYIIFSLKDGFFIWLDFVWFTTKNMHDFQLYVYYTTTPVVMQLTVNVMQLTVILCTSACFAFSFLSYTHQHKLCNVNFDLLGICFSTWLVRYLEDGQKIYGAYWTPCIRYICIALRLWSFRQIPFILQGSNVFQNNDVQYKCT